MASLKRKWYYLLSLPVLLILTLVAIRPHDKHFKFAKNLELFSKVLKEVDSNYVEDIDLDVLVKEGIDGMMDYLDPYSEFIPEEKVEQYNTYTTGEYGGIGAFIGRNKKEKRFIVSIHKGAPAHKSGIWAGDEILQVNGEDVTKKSLSQISNLMKGTPGTQVQILVAREGSKDPILFTVNREKVILKSVPYYGKVHGDIGYIKISNFSTHTSDEVRSALESLKGNVISKLVLDLRGNPGGILDEAVKTVNLFIDKGRVVVETKGKNTKITKQYCTQDPVYDKEIPIVVLVDQGSASAAEILAGVIQDYDRGVVIGKTTFGKGLVQIVKPLIHNTKLKLTNAKYYIPSGRNIQGIDYSRKVDKKTTEEPTKENVVESAEVPKKIFKTTAGRKVYESNGITPDIEVEQMKYAPITVSLDSQRVIYDFATHFRSKYREIATPQRFELSETQYQEFVQWIKNQELNYTIEHSIDIILEQAQQDNYSEEIKNKIKFLKTQINHHKEEDLQKFKSEIKSILESSIVERYYFHEGGIEASLKHDKEVQKACSILKNMDEYRAVLKTS